MKDLLAKLNTLVKASINDVLGDELSQKSRQHRALKPEQLGKNIDQEIAALRQRINDAVDYEGTLESRVQALRDEVTQWDQKADAEVSAGDDVSARYSINQMQVVQQRLAQAESDLQDHRLVTEELIQRVNTLEAVVADARRAQAEKSTEEAEEPAEEATVEANTQAPARMLADMLNEARETINRVGEMLTSPAEVEKIPESEPVEVVDEANVEDDLAERRQRLSKPK